MEPRPSDSAPYPFPYAEDYSENRRATELGRQHAVNPELDAFESSLVRQALAENAAYQPGGAYFDGLTSQLALGAEPTVEEVANLGLTIGCDIAEQSNPRKIVTAYLQACHSIDQLKIGMAGHASETRNELWLLHFVRKPIVEALLQHERANMVLTMTADALLDIHNKTGQTIGMYPWLHVKTRMLFSDYINTHGTRHNIALYYKKTEGVAAEQAESSETDKQISQLTAEAMQARKYGLKPAYTRASIGGSWIFYDGLEYQRKMNQDSTNRPMPLAEVAVVVHHTPQTELQDLRIKTQEHALGNAVMHELDATGLGGAQPDLTIMIDHQGRMSRDYDGLIPLHTLAPNNPRGIQALEAEIAANLFDLTMPINREHRPRNFKGLTPAEQTSFDPIIDLVAPRIKYLETTSATERQTVENPLRTIREHDVVWHVRILPDGWSASPEALENAARNGVKLAANETFVRSHKRGKENPVLGHKVVKRVIDDQAS